MLHTLQYVFKSLIAESISSSYEDIDLRAALVANGFLGVFPPVDLRDVCFARAKFSSVLLRF